MNDDLLFRYWGKADSKQGSNYHLLAYHSLDVAAVGYCILNEHPLLVKKFASGLSISYEDVIPCVSFLLSLHDLGKWSEGFQKIIKNLFSLLNGTVPRLDYRLKHGNLGLSMLQDGILERLFRENEDLFGKIPPNEEIFRYRHCLNAILGHHGMPPNPDEIARIQILEVATERDLQAAYDFVNQSAHLFFKKGFKTRVLPIDDFALARISWLLSGLVIISDWIASSDVFPYKQTVEPLETYWENSLQIAEKTLPICGLSNYPVSQKTGVVSLFPSLGKEGRSPSPLQELVSSCEIGDGPHLFIIEESTGGGKTEAAVTLAHRLMASGHGEGIFVGLPTMATANAMYDRMKQCYNQLYQPGNRPSLILAHGSRHLSDSFISTIGPSIKPLDFEYQPGEDAGGAICSRWLTDHRKSSLLASIGVGTIDQGLIGVLPVKHQALRVFGLARNVLIVDEVHAYDTYMNRLLQSLLAFQAALGGSAILLSATLPKKQKEAYITSYAKGAGYSVTNEYDISYPLITHVRNSPGKKENPIQIPVSPRPGTERDVKVIFLHSTNEVIEYLKKSLVSGRCACWIRNTVQDAVDAYQMMEKRGIASKLLLFHARFAMGDRLEKEREVLSQFGFESKESDRRGVLLIATQVVEQSLDIDFDVMVTDLAPIDLVIQRAGRLHRHNRGERGEPVLGIFSPPFDENPTGDWYFSLFQNGGHVYPYHGQLWLTAKVLRLEGSIKTPERSRFLMDYVYGDTSSQVPPGLAEQEKITSQRDRRAAGLAKNRVLLVDHGYELESGLWGEDDVNQTRLSDPTILVRLCVWDPQTRTLTLWRIHDTNPVEMSQLQVSLHRYDVRLKIDPDLSRAIEELKVSLPDKGKWSRILPLIYREDRYSCRVVDSGGKEMEIQYSKNIGLSIGYAP